MVREQVTMLALRLVEPSRCAAAWCGCSEKGVTQVGTRQDGEGGGGTQGWWGHVVPYLHAKEVRGCASGRVAQPESLVRFVELLKLCTLAASTEAEYLRDLRKLAARMRRDPAALDERKERTR
jgi:hypothetical protein